MKRCPACHVENREQARRCMACNAKLPDAEASARGVAAPPPPPPPKASPPPPPPKASPPPAKPAERSSGKTCPAGHPMDPAWSSCPYCKATREASPAPPAPALAAVRAPAGRKVAMFSRRIENPPPASPGARRKTVFQAAPPELTASSSSTPSAPAAGPAPGPAAVPSPEVETPPPSPAAAGAGSPSPAPVGGRRIVGILVTYSWRGEGQLFPIREGRNFLGSDPEGDVALDLDDKLSGRHTVILYRGRGFWINDADSMNGTFMNGECIEEKARLPNHAEIRTGSTVWRFVALEQEEVDVAAKGS